MACSSSAASKPAYAAVAGLAVLTALLAGCGSGTPSGQPGTTVTVTHTAQPNTSAPATNPATTPPASSAPAGPAGCATSALTLKRGLGQGTAGSLDQNFVFTNVGSVTCTLYGYPGVSVAGPSGQIGQPASRESSPGPSLVTLAPGQKANFTVTFVDAGNFTSSKCGLTNASTLVVYPPNQTASVSIPFAIQACSKNIVTMHTSVVSPGNGGS
jgi:Protein of unknown function (DUF4232)